MKSMIISRIYWPCVLFFCVISFAQCSRDFKTVHEVPVASGYIPKYIEPPPSNFELTSILPWRGNTKIASVMFAEIENGTSLWDVISIFGLPTTFNTLDEMIEYFDKQASERQGERYEYYASYESADYSLYNKSVYAYCITLSFEFKASRVVNKSLNHYDVINPVLDFSKIKKASK